MANLRYLLAAADGLGPAVAVVVHGAVAEAVLLAVLAAEVSAAAEVPEAGKIIL